MGYDITAGQTQASVKMGRADEYDPIDDAPGRPFGWLEWWLLRFALGASRSWAGGGSGP
jgi:hypothetical protein